MYKDSMLHFFEVMEPDENIPFKCNSSPIWTHLIQ